MAFTANSKGQIFAAIACSFIFIKLTFLSHRGNYMRYCRSEFTSILCKNIKQKMKNLEQQIEELNENLAKKLPEQVLKVFNRSIQDLKTKTWNSGDTDHTITYKFVDTNYMNRINVQKLMKQ
jgi:hypothetical protein